MQLGLIGLGRMGGNMADRIRSAGHEVVGFDHHPDKRDVSSLAELVEKLQGAFAAVGLYDLEPAFGQAFGHQPTQGGLVVDKEKMGGSAHLGGCQYIDTSSAKDRWLPADTAT